MSQGRRHHPPAERYQHHLHPHYHHHHHHHPQHQHPCPWPSSFSSSPYTLRRMFSSSCASSYSSSYHPFLAQEKPPLPSSPAQRLSCPEVLPCMPQLRPVSSAYTPHRTPFPVSQPFLWPSLLSSPLRRPSCPGMLPCMHQFHPSSFAYTHHRTPFPFSHSSFSRLA